MSRADMNPDSEGALNTARPLPAEFCPFLPCELDENECNHNWFITAQQCSLKNCHQMYENPDTTNMSHTFDKNDTNYVKYLPFGATVFAAGKACLVDMNVCIL